MEVKSAGLDVLVKGGYQPAINNNSATASDIKLAGNAVGSIKQVAVDDSYSVLEEKRRDGNVLSVSEKVILDTIEKANKAVDGVKTCFKFSIHKETHEIMVKVLNSETNEVIREIPPEKVLDMVAKMWEMAGLIVDQKM